jgi:hypothetical protein
MSQGRLFLGLRNEPSLLEANQGRTDHGTTIEHRITTRPMAPAGAGGEAIFPAARIVVTHDVAFTLTVTPMIDGVAIAAAARSLTFPAPADRQTSILEIGLGYTSQMPSGRVIGKFFPKGTWGQLQIELSNVGAGVVDIEPPELEYEVVRESRGAAA